MGCSPSAEVGGFSLPTVDGAKIDKTYGKCTKHGNIPFTHFNEKDSELYCSVCYDGYKRRNVRNGMKHCVEIDRYIESLTFKQQVVRLEEEIRNRKRLSENKLTNLKRSIQTIGTQKCELIDEINSFVDTIITLLKHLAEDMCKRVSDVIKLELDSLSNAEIRISGEHHKLEEIGRLLDIGKHQRNCKSMRLCSIIDSVKGVRQLGPPGRDVSQIDIELTLNKSLRLGDIKGTASSRSNLKLGDVNVIRHDLRNNSVDYTIKQSNAITLTDISETEDSDLEKSTKSCIDHEKNAYQKEHNHKTIPVDANSKTSGVEINGRMSSNDGQVHDDTGVRKHSYARQDRRRSSSDSQTRDMCTSMTSVSVEKSQDMHTPSGRLSSDTLHTATIQTGQDEGGKAKEHTGDRVQTQNINNCQPPVEIIYGLPERRSTTPIQRNSIQLRRQFERDKTLASRFQQPIRHNGIPIFSSATPSVRRSSQSVGTSHSITTPSGIQFDTKGSNEMTYRQVVKLDQFEVAPDKYKANITDSAFLHDGSLVLCDSKNACLNLFNSEFEYLDRVSLDNQPHNVTVTSVNQVAVSLPNVNTICYVNIVAGKFSDKSLHKRFRTIAPCRGVACIKGSLLYTTRKDVLILKHTDNDLKYKYQFREPVSLTADEVNKRLFVSCIGLKSFGEVVVMTTSGDIEFTVSGGKVTHPVGCTLDRERNIYICDVDPPRIHQVTSEGSSSRVLMESETEKYQHINFLPQEDIFIVTTNDSNIVTFYEMV